jgi:hypothetical protein
MAREKFALEFGFDGMLYATVKATSARLLVDVGALEAEWARAMDKLACRFELLPLWKRVTARSFESINDHVGFSAVWRRFRYLTSKCTSRDDDLSPVPAIHAHYDPPLSDEMSH